MDASAERGGWCHRLIPTKGAVKTAVHTAEDGHQIRADLFGAGAKLGEPHRLIVTCFPIEFTDGAPDAELWPTILELISAADELAPGDVLSLMFFGNPRGVERVPVPPGTARSFEVTQIGALTGAGEIEIVRS